MSKIIYSGLFGGVAVAAAVGLCGAVAQPAQKAPATTASAKTVAEYPVGPGSLNGVWVSPNERYGDRSAPEPLEEPAVRSPAGVVVAPWAMAIAQKRRADALAGHPYAGPRSRCLPAGSPDQFGGGTEQIIESPDTVAILTESGWHFNVIRMNQPHLPDPDPSYMGDSVGHWEGDTLVIDTIAISDKVDVVGFPHSDQLHTLTRVRRVDRKTIEFKITIEDPKTFNKPFTQTKKLLLLNEPLNEFICDNDRNTPDENGNLTVVKQGNN